MHTSIIMFEPSSQSLWLHRRQRQKERERNIPSALLCLVLIVIVATALAHPHWFHLKGGGCSRQYIGVQEFFFEGSFEFVTPPSFDQKEDSLIYYGLNERMRDCVTPQIVKLQRTVMILCFLAILCMLTQFFMDLIGVTHKWLKHARRNALGSIISALLMVAVIGLCFYASELMKTQQEKTKIIPTTSVQVDFAVSYYLIVGAGVISIIAAGTNLLQRYPAFNSDDGEILLDDCQGETFSVALPHSHTWSNFRHQIPILPELPPPPYTP